MSPIMFLVGGLLLVWLVFTGRARGVWDAMTNASPVQWSGGGPTGGSGDTGASGGGSRGFR